MTISPKFLCFTCCNGNTGKGLNLNESDDNDDIFVVLIDENKETLEQFKADRHAETQHREQASLGALKSCQNKIPAPQH